VVRIRDGLGNAALDCGAEEKIQGTSSCGVRLKAVFHPVLVDRISTGDGSAMPVRELTLTDVKVRSSGGVELTLVQLVGEGWWLMRSWDRWD